MKWWKVLLVAFAIAGVTVFLAIVPIKVAHYTERVSYDLRSVERAARNSPRAQPYPCYVGKTWIRTYAYDGRKHVDAGRDYALENNTDDGAWFNIDCYLKTNTTVNETIGTTQHRLGVDPQGVRTVSIGIRSYTTFSDAELARYKGRFRLLCHCVGKKQTIEGDVLVLPEAEPVSTQR